MVKPMTKQHTHARNLLMVIRDRIERGEPPIWGYHNAATLTGLKGEDYSVAFGQVCSRIDAASFIAGWPLLALRMVKKTGGAINIKSLTNTDWAQWNDEFRSKGESHQWTVQQVDEVIEALEGFPNLGAEALWNSYLEAEREAPGFINRTLHRKLKAS